MVLFFTFPRDQELHFNFSSLKPRAMTYKVAAFYRFVSLTDLPELQRAVKAFCVERQVYGTTLIAPEGVNGTMAGSPDDLDAFVAMMEEKFELSKGELKFSTALEKPFQRIKIRLKKEIITLKRPEADPTKIVGRYVEARDWNALISDPDVILIDTRNAYETEVGIFKGAIDPHLDVFSQFPEFVEQNLDPKKHKKIAMFCTGGIRCEKASAYMLAHGFENVYHLKGGILKYLEDVPEEESLWDGGCYVFGDRCVLGRGLEEA